ncbi:universal stress protein [Alkalilimnicola ehrlichii]|uniref:universal stress protein n=1 Tax=Alkalilimnicola ehrlichii TaxID=351052 RepID=UPI003B9F5E21
MYHRIMFPVDLAHLGVLERALQVSADMAAHYKAEVCYVSVIAGTPGQVARSPAEYEQKLKAFSEEQRQRHGQRVSTKVYISADPVADVDDLLVKAADEVGADLVIMGTHLPRKVDAIMPSHGGKVARQTDVSVFLVRPPRA